MTRKHLIKRDDKKGSVIKGVPGQEYGRIDGLNKPQVVSWQGKEEESEVARAWSRTRSEQT